MEPCRSPCEIHESPETRIRSHCIHTAMWQVKVRSTQPYSGATETRRLASRKERVVGRGFRDVMHELIDQSIGSNLSPAEAPRGHGESCGSKRKGRKRRRRRCAGRG